MFLIIFIKYILKTNDCLAVVWKWNDHGSAGIRVALVSATVVYISSPDHPVPYKRDLGDEFSEVVLMLVLYCFCFAKCSVSCGRQTIKLAEWARVIEMFFQLIFPHPPGSHHRTGRVLTAILCTKGGHPMTSVEHKALLPKESRITRNFLAIGTSCQLVPSWLMVCFCSLYSSFSWRKNCPL